MKIFADFHHEHLYDSLRILFEERLGWELYRAIGLDWYHEKFWHVYPHPATAEQYLGFHIGKDFQKMVEDDPEACHTFRNSSWTLESSSAQDIFAISSLSFPKVVYKGITLDTFKEMDFDLIISSMPQHVQPFKDLINLYQPQAKHIFQIGNNWGIPNGVNILTSAATISHPEACFYHQEFNLDLFHKKDISTVNTKSVANMMHYIQGFGNFAALEASLPDWNFKAHGSGNRDGPRGPDVADVAKAFEEFGFLWHYKKEGDGYGYNIHHAAATGTPMLVNKKHFKGMTAEALLIDGVTCIDLDRHSLPAVTEILKDASENYERWSTNTYNRFKEVVDFDKEFEEIKRFLENLQ